MCKGLSIFPIALVTLSILTFVTTYIIAVVHGHVSAWFPYISDTGTSRPESCLFGFFLNCAAFLSFCTMYIRYKFILTISEEERNLKCSNCTGLIFGAMSSVGLAIVANVQETAIYGLHMTGAALTLGGGIVYMLTQIHLSYKISPMYNTLFACRLRLFIAVQCIVYVGLFFIGDIISRSQITTDDTLHWKKEDGGFVPHIISTLSEWLACFAYLVFFLTFVRDLEQSNIDITLKRNGRETTYINI